MPIEWRGEQMVDDVSRRIDENMLKLGRDTVTSARTFAPHKTGYLRDSISFDYNLSTHTLVFVVEAEYGIFVEYGTRHMRPIPYLRPAINAALKVYGFDLEMAFANTPYVRAPIIAEGAQFHLPSTLTPKQLKHVREHLLPTSKRLHIGNVSRTKMHLRKY